MLTEHKLIAAIIIVVAFSFAALVALGGSQEAKEPGPVDLTQFTGSGGSRAFVEYIDGLIDELPAQMKRPMVVSNQSVQLWEYEVLPYFTYERLVNFPVVPAWIQLTPYPEGQMHNHILGRAYCYETPGIEIPKYIELNARIANPVSSWYGEPERFLPTLIHELIHIQGVCGDGELSETATQVVTLETLAALVNHGNRHALYPLLLELRQIGLASLYFEAIDNGPGSMESYEEFRNRVYDHDPYEIARAEKSQRYWFQSYASKARLIYILRAYNANVWELMQKAFLTGWAPEIHIPDYQDRVGHLNPSYTGTRDYRMDDLNYFVRHAAEIVRRS